ncbi:MAG: ATP-binding cassette domain-containing protein [Halobacteriaceae archaeon]
MSGGPADAEDHIVEMEGITKTFGEVVALEGVDLHLRRNEVLALAGDNGAGKSTLIKCLAGAFEPDEGTIRMNGEVVRIDSPRVSKRLGIETTFQDLAVAGNLSVTQNIFLGREDVTGPSGLFGVLDKRSMRERARELLEDLEIGVDVDEKVSNLSGGERQLVAISRTMLSDPEIVIMDEPTSALSVEGAERVLELIDRMQEQGISIILISHNLDYMQRAADRIQVLHHGHNAGILDATATSRDEIVKRMVGGMPDEERGDADEPGSGERAAGA